MSLLLTRHVEDYGIDSRLRLRQPIGRDCLGAASAEPLEDEFTMERVVLHHQHTFHGASP